MQLKKTIYSLFNTPEKSRSGIIINTIIYILIIISILNLMFYSVDSIRNQYGHILDLVRNIVMPIFVVEYILRLYASGYSNKYKGFSGVLRYMKTPYAVIDLLSIVPYFLINISFDSSFIRSLRILRIFRLFRAKKYKKFINLMGNIFVNIKEELAVLLFYMVVMIILLSFIMFEIEHNAQPEVFTNVFQTIWWAIATLTTVGYGDMYPITFWGEVITSIIAILGIGFIAIPGGMFASEFMTAINEEKKRKDRDSVCMKCGSSSLVQYLNPTVVNSDNTFKFDVFYMCEKCKFSWLLKENIEEQ